MEHNERETTVHIFFKTNIDNSEMRQENIKQSPYFAERTYFGLNF